MPPNRHFTTTIANIAPRAACQSGIVAGRFSARRRPVTAGRKVADGLLLLADEVEY